MSHPVWVTKSGILYNGIYEYFLEQEPISVTLLAMPASIQNTIVYSILNGSLPESTSDVTKFRLSSSGVLTGTASKATYDRLYSFTVRAIEVNSNNKTVGSPVDRTFSIRISGQYSPSFDPTESIYLLDSATTPIPDSVWVDYKIKVINNYTNSPIEMIYGKLPLGLTIDSQGLIRGYPERPFDTDGNPTISQYDFVLKVGNEYGFEEKQFTIFVQNQEYSEEFAGRKPVILNNKPESRYISTEDDLYPYYTDSGNIGRYKQGDTFNFKLLGKTPYAETNEIQYEYTCTQKLLVTETISGLNYLVCQNTGAISLGQGIIFLDSTQYTGSTLMGGIVSGVTYYVREIISDRIFRIGDSLTGSITNLQNSLGNMYGDLQLPPGISLDNGWLTGKFTIFPSIIDTYYMTFYSVDTVTGLKSDPEYFTLSVVGVDQNTNVNEYINWVSNSDLGILKDGELSTLQLVAKSTSGAELEYKILSPEVIESTESSFICNDTGLLREGQPIIFTGEVFGGVILGKKYYVKSIIDSHTFSISLTDIGEPLPLTVGTGRMNTEVCLPSNLVLLPSGEISGKVDFELGSTSTTVGDSKIYQFTVSAYNKYYPEIYGAKLFTLSVKKTFEKPYENIYLKALLNASDKDKVISLFWDTKAFPIGSVYRKTDKNFGMQVPIIIKHLTGLKIEEVETYIDLLNKNHYRKRLVLGPAEYAEAKDENGNVVYEAVFSRVMDNLQDSNETSISKNVYWPRMIDNQTSVVYPNSIVNMKTQITQHVEVISRTAEVPLWMTTIQKNGRSIGFIPCWVLCYANPGFGKNMVTEINSKYKFNEINFEIDRIIIDKSLSYNYDTTSGWTEYPSNGVSTDDKNQYVYFPKTTILK
jgi:hypothetical protein